jgi:hypothetical protein
VCVSYCFQVIAQRLSKLGTFKKAGAPGRLPAEVLIKRRKRGRNGEVSWEVVRARGHLDEVLEMCKGGCKLGKLTAVYVHLHIITSTIVCKETRRDLLTAVLKAFVTHAVLSAAWCADIMHACR